MKKLAALLAVSLAGAMVSACGHGGNAASHDADVQALKDVEAQWNQDYASKDVGKLVAHYADDAVLMVPGMAPMSGKDAIQAEMKTLAADPALDLKFQSSKVVVSKDGGLGYTQGAYTIAYTDPQSKQVIQDHGSYVTTYRKQADGSWKAVTDIANSEAPPPPPPAPKAHKPAKHGKHARR